MKLLDYVVSLATGTGQNAVAVSVKKMSDDSLVEAVNTAGSDENGQWTHTSDGCPGRVYAVATYAGNTRRLYSARSNLHPGGWTDLELVELYGQWQPGVLPDVAGQLVVGAPGSMFVSVASGAAVANGQLYRKWSGSGNDLVVPPNATGSTRKDNVIVRFTRSGANIYKSELIYEAGDLSLTQDGNTWEIALAQIAVPNGASAITSGMITGKRQYTFLPVGNTVVVDTVAQSNAENPTNSTVSYLSAVTINLVLPLGTWMIKATGGVNMKHSASGYGSLRLRIGSFTGVERSVNLETTYEHVVDTGEVTLDTDGAEIIVLDYKRVDAGTVSVRHPWINVTAIRQ